MSKEWKRYNKAGMLSKVVSPYNFVPHQEAIAKGVGVNEKDKTDNISIHHAAQREKSEVEKCLHKNPANINAIDKNGCTPLHHAARHVKSEVVKYLCENQANINAIDRNGCTPLHYANRSLEVVKYFVEKGADLKAKDNGGRTPLHYAVTDGKLEIVEYLCEKGAEVNAKDTDGASPLHYAVLKDHLKVIEYLCENGASVTQDIINQATENKSILLEHLITARWCQDILSNQPSYQDIRTIPVDLIQRVMRGQLALKGSLNTLEAARNSDNEVMKEIFTEDFVSEVTDKIVIKHKVPELYEDMLKGEPYYEDNLQNLPESSQKLLVQGLKSLCVQRGITSYKNSAGAINSNTIPDYVKTAINEALREGQQTLEVVESSVMNHIYKVDELTAADAHSAATKIQKVVRGHNVREKVKKANEHIIHSEGLVTPVPNKKHGEEQKKGF